MNKSESKYFNTASLMDEALLCLLEKKDFEYITVKEICKKAGVNRSTFYLHYENVNDLLAETIELINKKFLLVFQDKKKKIKNIPCMKKEDLIFISPEYLTPYLEFIKQNQRIFRTTCRNPKLFEAEKTFTKMYAEIFKPILNKFNLSLQDQSYVFEFYAHGILAIIMKWVSLNCEDSVQHIQKLILDCVDVKRYMSNEELCQ